MIVRPDLDTVATALDSGRPVLVWTTLVADLETPVSAMLKLADGRPNSFLLESVEGGAARGRYSVIGLKPDLIWRCHGSTVEINRNARLDADAFEPVPDARPLDSLRALIAECRVDVPAPLPPMASGLFGYLGYGMVGQVERLPDANPDTLGIPDALLLRPTVVAIFDNIEDQVIIVTPIWPGPSVDPRGTYEQARERLAEIVGDFAQSLPHRTEPVETAVAPEARAHMTPEAFKAIVLQAKEYIAAGDVFQVVPAQRFTVPFHLPPFAFYRALRRLNPSPFLFFLNFEGFSVVGSSPEILVRLRDGRVTIRPLAGTRKRGATPEEDRALAVELLADPKELAEHLMLVDLARNDVGRVAKVGTVEVVEREVIERYSHVMHISSTVEGEIDPKYDAVDALMAGFPAGTVSGAPKVRAMEIIDELETERRNVFGGAIGYFAANGAMDTCLGLRTAVVKDGRIIIQAGAGIVADSDPAAEYQETIDKARALVRAAEEAIRFAAGT